MVHPRLLGVRSSMASKFLVTSLAAAMGASVSEGHPNSHGQGPAFCQRGAGCLLATLDHVADGRDVGYDVVKRNVRVDHDVTLTIGLDVLPRIDVPREFSVRLNARLHSQ